jgi:hypothetical protein
VSAQNPALYVANDDVLTTKFGDEVVILNLRDGVYYGLEDVGARVWQLLERPVTVAAIRDALVSEFEVAPGRCERDVSALVASLSERGLVRIQQDR